MDRSAVFLRHAHTPVVNLSDGEGLRLHIRSTACKASLATSWAARRDSDRLDTPRRMVRQSPSDLTRTNKVTLACQQAESQREKKARAILGGNVESNEPKYRCCTASAAPMAHESLSSKLIEPEIGKYAMRKKIDSIRPVPTTDPLFPPQADVVKEPAKVSIKVVRALKILNYCAAAASIPLIWVMPAPPIWLTAVAFLSVAMTLCLVGSKLYDSSFGILGDLKRGAGALWTRATAHVTEARRSLMKVANQAKKRVSQFVGATKEGAGVICVDLLAKGQKWGYRLRVATRRATTRLLYCLARVRRVILSLLYALTKLFIHDQQSSPPVSLR